MNGYTESPEAMAVLWGIAVLGLGLMSIVCLTLSQIYEQ